jgi:hypothetical protein
MVSTLDAMLTAIGAAPCLPGARCRGRHHLFDPAGTHEPAPVVQQRHAQALGLCQDCPALEPCRAWVASLPPKRRPQGVVAGTIGGQDA